MKTEAIASPLPRWDNYLLQQVLLNFPSEYWLLEHRWETSWGAVVALAGHWVEGALVYPVSENRFNSEVACCRTVLLQTNLDEFYF